MDLNDFLDDFPGVSIFNKARDEAEALKIFEAAPMKLPGLDLIYDRSPEFSSLLRAQGPSHQTFVARHRGKMIGFASLSWGPRYVNGKIRTVSYIGDLRILPVREASLLIRKFYPALLDYARKYWGVDYHLTSILSDNKLALNSLVRETGMKKFKYQLLREVKMVNVLGKKPFKKVQAGLGKIERVPVTGAESREILSFMDALEQKKLFGFCLAESEWSRRLTTWPGLSTSTFLTYKTELGLRASCLPWAVTELKRLKVGQMRPWLKTSLLIPRLFGFKLPENGEALRIPYLTHLYFAEDCTPSEKAQILVSFIQEVKSLSWARSSTFISFEDPEEVHRAPEFSFYFTQVTRVGLYGVTREDTSIDVKVDGSGLGFEMALA